jgi:AcrR family transcriptional regulator
MGKQQKTTEKTKQNLIEAFWALYENKRIEKITVKEITTKAGYNRSTFYEYFLDVYDVLEQIENRLIIKLQEPLRFVSDADSPLPLEIFIKMYEEHSKYLVVLLGDRGDPSFQSKLKERMKPLIKQKLLLRGVQDHFEIDYTLEFTISAMIGILSYWFRNENRPPTEKLLALINKLSKN